MSVPAGWYPDPDPTAAPGSSRYWDGSAWTQEVRGEAPAPAGYGQGVGQQNPYAPAPYDPYGQNPYGQSPYPQGEYGGRAVTTPDGQPLSGYGRRAGAYLIDIVLLGVVTALVAWPWWSQMIDIWTQMFDDAFAAAEAGRPAPSSTQYVDQTAGPLMAVLLISLGLSLLYYCGFWKWRGATPGKLMLGLRIRRWDDPGSLGWGAVLLRFLGLNLGSLLNLIPILGSLLAVIWTPLDLLWPLWDKRRQALHDKFAGTVVVRER